MRGRALVLLAAAILGLPGCGGGEEGEAGSVEVALADFTIEPSSIEVEDGGEVTFSVRNDGDVPHALAVEGESTDTLAAGDSGELAVELAAGTHKLFCPVGNHRERGMVGTLTVGGGSGGGGGTTGEEEPGRDYGYG